MKIVFHPGARKMLIVLPIIVVLAIIFLSLRSAIFSHPSVSETDLAPDTQAAVNAVTAFYTLDYTKSPELWISNVCTYATDQGCNAIRSFFAPTIQSQVQNYQIQTGCNVRPIQLVEDDGDIRIWQVSVTLDHPWADLKAPTQDVLVEVAKVHGGWLMNRILFEQEIERFTTPTH
jgi:competence protein ComGC